MNLPITPDTKPASPRIRKRQRIYKELGLMPFLQQREVFTVGSLPIHCDLYRSSSADPVIIFLPGIGTYSELYCEFLSKLAKCGYNVIAVDPRGHGYSGGNRGAYTIEAVVSDLQLVIDEVQTQFQGPIGLFGCSLGARLSLAVAERDARVQSLLCHTLFMSELPPDIWHLMGWTSLSFSAFYMPGLQVNFRDFVDVDALLRNSPLGQYVDDDDLLVWDYPLKTLNSVFSAPSRAFANQLNFKAAIIVGEQDEVLSPAYTRHLVTCCSHPFELFVIPQAGHMLPFEHIPQTIDTCHRWFKQSFA